VDRLLPGPCSPDERTLRDRCDLLNRADVIGRRAARCSSALPTKSWYQEPSLGSPWYVAVRSFSDEGGTGWSPRGDQEEELLRELREAGLAFDPVPPSVRAVAHATFALRATGTRTDQPGDPT
jgi:hypothetical protein